MTPKIPIEDVVQSLNSLLDNLNLMHKDDLKVVLNALPRPVLRKMIDSISLLNGALAAYRGD